MKIKHTPAPWLYGAAGHIVEIYSTRKNSLPDRLLAQVIDVDPDNTRFETIANAKLIAAAPELLEALEEIKKLCDGNVTNENNIWHKANSAIKKATE